MFIQYAEILNKNEKVSAYTPKLESELLFAGLVESTVLLAHSNHPDSSSACFALQCKIAPILCIFPQNRSFACGVILKEVELKNKSIQYQNFI